MKHFDYIIVGSGIAATCFAGQLLKANQSFVLFDDQQRSATAIAGGTLNPVVLKRFTPVWGSKQFLDYATSFYTYLEEVLDASFLKELEIARIFHNVQEQNDWLVASDRKELTSLLDPVIEKQINTHVHTLFGAGNVQGGFQLHPKVLLRSFKSYIEKDHLRSEAFDYKLLEITDEEVQYKNIVASKIVFAEGVKILQNPLLEVPYLIPKKGEYLTVRIPNLELKSALKAGYFIIPLGDDCYKIGATFAHGDTSETTTKEGRLKLISTLEKVVNLPFEIVTQEYGMRPTVKDRRPLLGAIPNYKHCFILNGLGTRGLLMAPLLSEWLFNAIKKGNALPAEVNINRFY